jgi:hypothetical protein
VAAGYPWPGPSRKGVAQDGRHVARRTLGEKLTTGAPPHRAIQLAREAVGQGEAASERLEKAIEKRSKVTRPKPMRKSAWWILGFADLRLLVKPEQGGAEVGKTPFLVEVMVCDHTPTGQILHHRDDLCLAQGGSAITAGDAGFLSKGHGRRTEWDSFSVC